MTPAATTGPAVGGEPSVAVVARPGFAHASEAEFARILDFYQVEWRYEPHAFPILWSLDGDVLESFAPDFYLPELDLYVEMTTLRQKLVRKKNRKLRRLRELYPDIRIKLFYARDFRALMLKYGRVALADALSGSEGQFTPANPGPAAEPHPAEPAGEPAAVRESTAAVEPSGAEPAAIDPPKVIGQPSLDNAPGRATIPSLVVAPAPATGRRAAGASTAGPGRRRSRTPVARGARTAPQPQGIIGTDTPADPAATSRDEGVVR